ncbi:MAG: hypothetical protein M3R16_09965, partial [Pseudomonadota bacterium]|nr:hypothetical protein [Pseudomonadota bacterium]
MQDLQVALSACWILENRLFNNQLDLFYTDFGDTSTTSFDLFPSIETRAKERGRMRFSLQREVLLKPLAQVVNVVERRQTLP